MNQELLKKHIQNRLNSKVREFQQRDDIVCTFENPIVAYVDAEDVRFDALFARRLNDHPKRIYRPGKCIVVHYTPFTEEFVKENGYSKLPTEKWVRAYMESLWLAMELNRTIVTALKEQGRLTSYLNTMMEWDDKKCREEWSHKMSAVIGGIGKTGPAGSLIVNGRFGGRAGGIITDGLYAEKNATEEANMEDVVAELLSVGKYDIKYGQEIIDACPGGAISEEGIDKLKCQEFCRSLNDHIPMPEVCGRCFRFGR